MLGINGIGKKSSFEFSGKWKLSKHFGLNFNLVKQFNAAANLGARITSYM